MSYLSGVTADKGPISDPIHPVFDIAINFKHKQ